MSVRAVESILRISNMEHILTTNYENENSLANINNLSPETISAEIHKAEGISKLISDNYDQAFANLQTFETYDREQREQRSAEYFTLSGSVNRLQYIRVNTLYYIRNLNTIHLQQTDPQRANEIRERARRRNNVAHPRNNYIYDPNEVYP